MQRIKFSVILLVIFLLYKLFLYNQDKPIEKISNNNNVTYTELEVQQIKQEHFREIDNIHKLYSNKEAEQQRRDEESLKQQENIASFAQNTKQYISDFVSSPQGEQFIDTVISNLNNTENFDPYQKYKSNILKQGQGNEAECGDQVKVKYFISEQKNPNIANIDNNQELIIDIGNNNVSQDLQHAIIGMKQGEIITYPQKKNRDVQNYYAIKLLKTQKNQHKLDNIEILDKKIGTRNDFFKCGEKATFNAKIKDLRGNIILQKKENIIIGSKKSAYIFSIAVEKMSKNNSTRIVIFPGKLLQYFGLPNINSQELYILEVTT
jgi:hypothetical protein